MVEQDANCFLGRCATRLFGIDDISLPVTDMKVKLSNMTQVDHKSARYMPEGSKSSGILRAGLRLQRSASEEQVAKRRYTGEHMTQASAVLTACPKYSCSSRQLELHGRLKARTQNYSLHLQPDSHLFGRSCRIKTKTALLSNHETCCSRLYLTKRSTVGGRCN